MKPVENTLSGLLTVDSEQAEQLDLDNEQNRVSPLINLRVSILVLSVLLALTSLLIFVFSDLYYFNEESAEIMAVSELKSGGGDENFLFAIGFGLFLVLALFNFFRIKSPIVPIDIGALVFILLLQGFVISMVEVGSFGLSLQAHNGWILLIWLFAYSGLWLSLIATAWRLRG